jgi:hypothetical protein
VLASRTEKGGGKVVLQEKNGNQRQVVMADHRCLNIPKNDRSCECLLARDPNPPRETACNAVVPTLQNRKVLLKRMPLTRLPNVGNFLCPPVSAAKDRLENGSVAGLSAARHAGLAAGQRPGALSRNLLAPELPKQTARPLSLGST